MTPQGAAKRGRRASLAIRAVDKPPTDVSELTPEDAERLIFFERIFFELDDDGNGFITSEEVASLLAFTALDMSAAERKAVIRQNDIECFDGKLSRKEFLSLCVNVMWGMTVDQLSGSLENYKSLKEVKSKRVSSKWRNIANQIDRRSRFWFPFWYFTGIFFIYCLEFDDKYTNATQPMFDKLSGASIKVRVPDAFGRVLWFFIWPWGVGLAVATIITVLCMSALAKYSFMMQQASVLRAMMRSGSVHPAAAPSAASAPANVAPSTPSGTRSTTVPEWPPPASQAD